MQYPEPVVGAFIINPENKLFLMKSHKWSDMWVVPGGHIELDETIDHALKREIKEETNLDITNPKLIVLLESINDKEFHTKKHMIFFNYRADATSDQVSLNNEGQEYGWFDKNEVFTLPLNKFVGITLQNHLNEIFRPL